MWSQWREIQPVVCVGGGGGGGGQILDAIYIQWKLSNPDTLGTEESVLISEVS